MKMRVEIMRYIEVESSDPIFEELYQIHALDGCAEVEKYSAALDVIERLTGIPTLLPENETDEFIIAAYEASTNIPIFES